jgi:hypothetical protein
MTTPANHSDQRAGSTVRAALRSPTFDLNETLAKTALDWARGRTDHGA